MSQMFLYLNPTYFSTLHQSIKSHSKRKTAWNPSILGISSFDPEIARRPACASRGHSRGVGGVTPILICPRHGLRSMMTAIFYQMTEASQKKMSLRSVARRELTPRSSISVRESFAVLVVPLRCLLFHYTLVTTKMNLRKTKGNH